MQKSECATDLRVVTERKGFKINYFLLFNSNREEKVSPGIFVSTYSKFVSVFGKIPSGSSEVGIYFLLRIFTSCHSAEYHRITCMQKKRKHTISLDT